MEHWIWQGIYGRDYKFCGIKTINLKIEQEMYALSWWFLNHDHRLHGLHSALVTFRISAIPLLGLGYARPLNLTV